jgi:hypothetical protein
LSLFSTSIRRLLIRAWERVRAKNQLHFKGWIEMKLLVHILALLPFALPVLMAGPESFASALLQSAPTATVASKLVRMKVRRSM